MRRIKERINMKLKQGVSMALTLAVLCGGAAEASKEEVIYGVLV